MGLFLCRKQYSTKPQLVKCVQRKEGLGDPVQEGGSEKGSWSCQATGPSGAVAVLNWLMTSQVFYFSCVCALLYKVKMSYLFNT